MPQASRHFSQPRADETGMHADGGGRPDEPMELLRTGCDEILSAGDEVHRLQAKWVRDAQAWLQHQSHGGYLSESSQPPVRELSAGSVFSLDSGVGKPLINSQKAPSRDTGILESTVVTNGTTHGIGKTVVCSSAPENCDDKKKLPSKLHSTSSVESTVSGLDLDSTPSTSFSSKKIMSPKARDETLRSFAINAQLQERSTSLHSLATTDALPAIYTVRGIRRIVEGQIFKIAVGFAILTNVVFVGVEVEYLATHLEEKGSSKFFEYIQMGYTVFFFVELCLRLFAWRLSFFTNHDWSWNLFDFFVVVSAILEAVASSTLDMTHLRVVRLIRVTRLIRTMRVLKMVQFVRALKTLVQSIAVTLKHVTWSLLLLLMIVYGFGVAFAQAVVDSCAGATTFRSDLIASGCEDPTLEIFWGSLPRSMFTLYKSIIGGINWHEPVLALGNISGIWVMIFLVYVTFTVFAVLNVVTGVFCQSAFQSVQEDKEVKTMQLMAHRGLYESALEKLFDEIDANCSEEITLDEFEKSLSSPRVQAYFESLEITTSDAWALFKLLDSDNSGSIDKDEFLMGCIQFQGGAKAVDIAKMAYENKAIFNMLEDCMGHFDEQLTRVLNAINVNNGTEEISALPESTQVHKRAHRQVPRKMKTGFELDACTKEAVQQVFHKE